MMTARRPLIIVVDDEQAIRDFLCDLLSDEGYQSIGCHDAREAFEIIQESQPALVITDLWMEARYAGYELLRRIRNTSAVSGTPVILYAADQRFLHDNSQSLQALNCAPLHKPASVDEIVAMIRRLIGAPQVLP